MSKPFPYKRSHSHKPTATIIGNVKDQISQVDLRFKEALTSTPLVIRIKGSIFPHVVLPLILFTIYSSLYAFFGAFGVLPDLGSTLIPILSMVTGLMVSFRTSSAYERWSEGRRQWEVIHTVVRNITRNFWLGTTKHPAGRFPILKGDGSTSEELRTLVRLPVAFAVAIKHHLRGEHGADFEDLRGYLPEPFIERCQDMDGPDNLPLDILMLMQSYLTTLHGEGSLEQDTFSILNSSISRMVEVLGSVERIVTTPIPLAYAIHFKQMISLYCLSLPPQLVGTLGVYAIPVTCIAVFTFFGIDALGTEIENPFGYDDNDLPLDEYCDTLKDELENILAQPPLDVRLWRTS